MSWIIISKSCQDCGGEIAFRILDTEPTEEDVRANEDELGGMFCITSHTKEIEEGEINKIVPSYY